MIVSIQGAGREVSADFSSIYVRGMGTLALKRYRSSP